MPFAIADADLNIVGLSRRVPSEYSVEIDDAMYRQFMENAALMAQYQLKLESGQYVLRLRPSYTVSDNTLSLVPTADEADIHIAVSEDRVTLIDSGDVGAAVEVMAFQDGDPGKPLGFGKLKHRDYIDIQPTRHRNVRIAVANPIEGKTYGVKYEDSRHGV